MPRAGRTERPQRGAGRDSIIAPIPVTTLVDSLLAGGAERVAIELACALDRSRFEPHVIVTRGDGPLRSLLDDADVPYTLLERRRAFDLRAWRRAHRLIAATRVAGGILHAHKFGSNAWAALLARTAGVPLVVHEHNFSAEPSRLRSIIDRRWIATRAQRVLCVSDSVADVERSNGVPARLVEVVPNGVRLDAAWPAAKARSELALDPGAFIVGIVGRLRPEKAHEVLLRAVAELTQGDARVHVPLQLCIVGDGPRRDELATLAHDLGIDEHVAWAGERQDAATLAAAFDAAVICSHWEGLPLAALEAMAAGVPLVASRVGGLPTLLAGGAGVLATPGESSTFAAALRALIEDVDHRATVAATGRGRIESTYSFARMVSHVEGIYDEVSATHQARDTHRRTAAHAPDQHAQDAA
ncbi:MAG: glycosyl transferase group 1 [Thermoleophilia bacterium]|nr:glycosyl transferase group 1 [Thermoleophilia bacterium]